MDQKINYYLKSISDEFENCWYMQKELFAYVNEQYDGNIKLFFEELSQNCDYNYLGNVLIAFMTDFKNDTLETTVWGKGQINQPKMQ